MMPSLKKNSIAQMLHAEHSREQTDKIVQYINNHTEGVDELWHCYLSSDVTLAQRSAWVIGHYYRSEPSQILVHLPQIIPTLEQPLHPAQVRNVMNILSFTTIPEDYHGALLDICLAYITDHTSPSAIRAFSLSVAADIGLRYPEIAEEIIGSVESLEASTPAIRSRWRKLGPKLKKVVSENLSGL